MIDFHTHVLPGIDDGSRGTDMSMQMLETSYNYGIDVMVATPHFYIRHTDVEGFLRHRNDSYRALMHKAKSRNTPIPDIRLGAEVFYFTGISALEDLDKLCIEGTKYLLLENHLAIGNFGGFPSITIPSGLVDNMPVAINITGPIMSDDVVFNIAKKLEEKIGFVPLSVKEEK